MRCREANHPDKPTANQKVLSTEHMIQVTNFSKQYKGFAAVKNLSFTVEPGQILGLLGPNGAGKTTTLRTLCGIIPPSSGSLLVAGHDVVEALSRPKRTSATFPTTHGSLTP
jgi:ABC-2 type transport system ATP-binding protein